METQSLRLRLVFQDPSILTKTQRSDEMNHSWLLLKLQQHPTISDVCTHLHHIFKLHRSCPNGILLSMEGFTLPSFESTEILKDKEIICVKKKGGTTPGAGNLLDEVEDDGLLLLENQRFDKVGESESEEVDEERSRDEELPEGAASKKRKASTNLQNLKKKKRYVEVLDDDVDETETDESENDHNDASHPMAMKISIEKETNIKAAISNKKVKSHLIVERSEELPENVEEVNQVSTAPGAKKISRSSRRQKHRRKKKQEFAKIAQKKPKTYLKPEVPKHKREEADNGQPKGLLYWKKACKNLAENGDVGPGPVHIRFEAVDQDEAVKHTELSRETFKRNGSSSSKRKGQKWGREKFLDIRRNESKRINKESFKILFKDAQVPVIDINDFDKLPPCSEPTEGDVIAYRLLELNSSWIPEFSSFRVGRIAYYDAKDIVLIPVSEYPIDSEKINDNGPNDPLYGEDGCLEINYSALVDVRNIMRHNPDTRETVNNGIYQTPPSKNVAENLVSNINDNNIDVPKDSNPVEGEVNPWDRLSSKNTEMSEPKHSGMNPCSYGEAGPSTTTGQDANEAESSGAKESQPSNAFNSWLAADKPDPSQENNASSPDVKIMDSTENDCENASSWGRPWSAFVVSRGSSVIQPYKESDWRVGSSHSSGEPWPRGGPRGRGRGRGRFNKRGRGRGRNG